jgi:alpha-amylase
MPVRLVFGLHDHQPVGNFDSVFEQNTRDAYAPFLDLMEQYPEIPVTLHTSGPLLEWLVARRPDYVDRLKGLAAQGRVEILGGAFYEPILPGIPSRDRVGQVRAYTEYLEKLFGVRVRGMWLAERVWEPELVSDLVAAGIEYTLLDDYHFRQAGLEDHQLHGYYLTEDEGRLLKVFPISEPMRYIVPWKQPEDAIPYLQQVAAQNPDAVVVCADDGEKFGGWPETHRHVYTNGWLRRFFDLLRENHSWIRFCTLGQAVDETSPAGLVYLPDCSYREMTEWALPTAGLQAYNQAAAAVAGRPEGPLVRRFLRGGFWRNFRAKYPEVQEMSARMLEVSRRVEAATASPLREAARRDLYRGQCNCAYWHGAFGGLYLPHLRNAVFHHLIRAENAVLPPGPATAEEADFNLDTFPEVRLSNTRLTAYFAPRRGGYLYELDVRSIAHNLLATLSRRPEAYHETILRAAAGGEARSNVSLVVEQARFKQQGLERLLYYDRYQRKSLVDHFLDPDVWLDDLIGVRERELGDFITGTYHHRWQKTADGVALTLTREGAVEGRRVVVTKVVTLRDDADGLDVHYRVAGLEPGRPHRFAVEFQFAGMAAGQDDRYFYHDHGDRAGQLQETLDLGPVLRIGLVDGWLGLDASLALSPAAGVWTFPIQTVSQSEGGFELVHQSTTVMPHWLIAGDAAGEWEATIRLRLDTSRAKRR